MFCIGVCLLFCDVLFFLPEKSSNWWRCFCDCENYCILWSVFRCVVRNFLLIYLLCDLIFGIPCAIPWSPYFLKRFCALLDCFFGANSSLIQVLPCADLSRSHLLVFHNFSLSYFASVCDPGFFYTSFRSRQLFLWCY